MSSGRGYRRVQSGDGLTSDRGRTRSERISDKLYAMGWLTAAVIVARWTNFYHVLYASQQVNRLVLHAALACLGIVLVLLLYLTVYLPKVVKLTDSSAWEVYCPKVIPSIGICGVVSTVLLVRATFPVWGFLSPLILGTQAMGALFATQLIPWCC